MYHKFYFKQNLFHLQKLYLFPFFKFQPLILIFIFSPNSFISHILNLFLFSLIIYFFLNFDANFLITKFLFQILSTNQFFLYFISSHINFFPILYSFSMLLSILFSLCFFSILIIFLDFFSIPTLLFLFFTILILLSRFLIPPFFSFVFEALQSFL